MNKRTMLLDLATGKTRPLRRTAPLVSSADKGWDGFLVEEYAPAESVTRNVALTDTVIFLILDGGGALEWLGEGQAVSKRLAAGQISILPADRPYSARFRQAGRSLVLTLEYRLLACAAAEQGSVGEVQPVWIHGAEDGLLRELLLTLREETRSGEAGGRQYAQTLGSTLAAHLAQRYTVDRLQPPVDRGGLSSCSLRLTVQWIQEHLAEDLSIARLARVAGLSPCHFARMFKQSTGMTPHQYVVCCRVSGAKRLLLHRIQPLADVALQAGFCDQGHMTRSFRTALGITPAAFVRQVSGRDVSPNPSASNNRRTAR